MKFMNKYFSFIKPNLSELLILVLFISGSACLETDSAFSQLGIYVDPSYESRKMVEVEGNIYVAHDRLHIIEQLNISTRVKTVWAGSSGVAGSTNGMLANARFNSPIAIAYYPSATPKLYIAEADGCVLREINMTTQTVTTVAGLATTCNNTDGVGTAARFAGITGMAISGTSLYIAQGYNIRKVDLTSFQVTSPLGTYSMVGNVNSTGTAARFSSISGLTVVGNTLFVADNGNNVIRAVDLSSLSVTTFSGTGTVGFVDGSSTTAQFRYINDITSDGSSYLFVTDFKNNSIRQIDVATGSVTTIVGDASTNQDIDGPLASAKIAQPLGITFSSYGLFFSNYDNIRRLH